MLAEQLAIEPNGDELLTDIVAKLAMDTQPIDNVLKNEYCQLLSIGYNHPSYDGDFDADGMPAFDEIEALYDEDKKIHVEKMAKQGNNGAESEDANRMRKANVAIADAMLPSQASQQLFQHNDTKTLDMYGN